jgi:hypothetical protein
MSNHAFFLSVLDLGDCTAGSLWTYFSHFILWHNLICTSKSFSLRLHLHKSLEIMKPYLFAF